MSRYEIGAFEALEWAWHMLRKYRDNPSGVEEARRTIHNILSNLGKGDRVNFREKLSNVHTQPYKPLIFSYLSRGDSDSIISLEYGQTQ